MTRPTVRALSIVAALLVSVPAAAQDPPPPPPAPPAPAQRPVPPPPPPPAPPKPAASDRNVQVDVKITIDGAEKPLVKEMSLVAADGQLALGRSGLEIPVSSGPMMGVATAKSFNYRHVGFNVDARPRVLDGGRIGVNFKLTFSTVYAGSTDESSLPSFGNGSTEMYLVFDSGKPTVLTQSADGESGRGFKVEAKATLLK